MKGILLLILAMAAIVAGHAKSDLEPYAKAAIATRFASEVKYNFMGYGKFGENFDSICRAELPSLVNTPSDEEFSQRLELLCNRLHDGHTGISYNADVSYAPVSIKRIGDQVYVTEVFSEEYTQKGVKRGTEILALDGMPVLEYGDKNVVPYIPSSTEQWSRLYPFSSINLTKGHRGEPLTITFRNPGGETYEIVDRRESPWGIVAPDMNVRYEELPGNIGLLTIPSFRAEYFTSPEVQEIFFNKIHNNDGLIVDIRDNTGGNSNVAEMVMMFLATDSVPQANWQTPRYEAAYASWGKPWNMMSVPSETLTPYFMATDQVKKYDKPIVLLINGLTFSASEGFAALFKNADRGKVVGTPSGGSTGNPIRIDLGWGYNAMICTRYEELADGTPFIGIGIQPDILVEEDEGVLYGKDKVLETALHLFAK